MTGSVGAWAGQDPPPPPESQFKWIPKGGGFWQCPMCDFKTKNKWYKSGKIRKRTKILKKLHIEIYFAFFKKIFWSELNFEKVTNGRTLVKSRFNVRIVQRHLPIDQDCRHI